MGDTALKFKIGDKVKYIKTYSSFIPCNSIGIIRHLQKYHDGYDVLFPNDIEWFCLEENLVKIQPKKQQLLFKFIE